MKLDPHAVPKKTAKAKGRSAPRRISNQELTEGIARLTWKVARDLGGFGGKLDAPRADAALRGALLEACRALLAAQGMLEGARDRFVQRQVAPIARARRRPRGSGKVEPYKLHIGGGEFRIEGWLNVDLPPADFAMDVLWGLPFAARSASFVFCSHLLEHLYFPHDALAFLRDVRRVLLPGGVLRVIVPDIGQYLSAYLKRDRAFFLARARVWPDMAGMPLLHQVLAYAGAGKRPDNFFGHRFGYDFETLRDLLLRAGFRRVGRSDYMKSRHAELRLDAMSHYAGARHRGGHYSLFVDATR